MKTEIKIALPPPSEPTPEGVAQITGNPALALAARLAPLMPDIEKACRDERPETPA